MKKLILLLCLLITLPANALVEICDSSGYHCVDFKEPMVKEIETTFTPTYGVNVILKNGHKNFVEASSRGEAVLMLNDAYYSLQKYYGWTDDYYYWILERQDKAQLRLR